MEYQLRYDKPLEFTSGQKVIAKIDSSCLLEAVHHTSSLIKQISNFPINIFEILGMRNLSAFVGEIFAASLITHSKGEFIKNPHQDGYPADSCDAAQAYRFDAARDSWMMPPTVTR